MNIQWYPGHMTKTRRQMESDVKLVDLVAEVVDARIPVSSRNPDIDAIVGDRPRVIIFNRADQADPAMTARWLSWFKSKGYGVLETDARSGKGVAQFSATAKSVLKDKLAAWQSKGQVGRPVRAMVGGVPNVGKSTFIKMLMGEVAPDSGHFDVGETVRFGYYSQDGLKFDEQMKVIDVVQAIAEYVDLGNGQKMGVSQFLNYFLFTPEKQHNYVYKLSGGEKRRLYLCTVLMRSPNFLVLDEPTNDLDIVTLNVLEEYLRNFKGCAIVVSHDRYFMDKVVDHLLVFRGNADIKDFPGNYTQYRDWKDVQDQLEKEAEAALQAKQNPAPEKPSRPVGEQKKKLTFKERKEFEALEEEIPALEVEKAELETAMSSGTLSPDELMAKSQRITQVMEEIDEKTMRWLELSELA